MNIENRKARHNYFIEEQIECGIELKGNEVKSIKSGMCTITDAWAYIEDGQVFLKGMHVAPWHTSNYFDISEVRDRKLLLHKAQIRKLKAQVEQQGITLVPLFVTIEHGLVKVRLGVCRGKHSYDKRATLKEKTIKREIEQSLRDKSRKDLE